MQLASGQMSRNQSVKHALIGIIFGGVLLAGPVNAQQVLEEVVVTAQKREQSLQDVPFSISALSGQDMIDAGLANIFDVANKMPSLEITQNAGPINTSFRIRRIGNEANIPNFAPAVGLFVDGAFKNRSGVGIGALVDLERIEVLRGPQSTLYGKNTSAGVINVITRGPTDEFEAWGEVTAGNIEGADNANLFRYSGAVSGPLLDGLKGRLTVSSSEHDPLFQNLTTGGGSLDQDNYTLRGQLLWDGADNWDIRLIADTFHIDNDNSAESEFDEGIVPGAINEGFGVPCPVNDPNDRKICWNRSLLNDVKASSVTALTKIRFDEMTLSSVTSYDEYDMYRDLDADQLNIDALDFFDRQNSESFPRNSVFSQRQTVT